MIDAHNRRKKIFRYNDDEYERITIFSYRKRDKENEKDDKIIFDYKQPIALGIRRKFSFRTIIKIYWVFCYSICYTDCWLDFQKARKKRKD